MNYWLVKSEPVKYAWEVFEKDKKTVWDGVRNYQARNNIRDMKKSDLVLFYHSNEGKEVVGIAKVVKEHFQDPTSDDAAWLSVELSPVKRLKKTVGLDVIKSDKLLQNIALVRNGRLSVMPLTEDEFNRIVSLGA
jgi:predicted RNA-binding protein with PUA-like domain